MSTVDFISFSAFTTRLGTLGRLGTRFSCPTTRLLLTEGGEFLFLDVRGEVEARSSTSSSIRGVDSRCRGGEDKSERGEGVIVESNSFALFR